MPIISPHLDLLTPMTPLPLRHDIWLVVTRVSSRNLCALALALGSSYKIRDSILGTDNVVLVEVVAAGEDEACYGFGF